MDRKTIFTKTAKGLMEATGKTSVLSRDLRNLLKEIDGKATLGEVWTKVGKVPEAKLQEALKALAKDDFIREFTQSARGSAPLGPAPQTPELPPKRAAADEGMDLDFTVSIPTLSSIAKQAEEAATQKAQAVAAAQAAARAKAEAEARARAAAAEAATRARVEAETKAKAEALEKAKAAAAAEAQARAKRDAEEQARREAEEKARREAAERARAEEQARIDAEARARKEAAERARVEAELKARLDEERKAREEAEHKAKEQAERERQEAEEKVRREADELRAKLEEERGAREEAERRAKEQAESERQEAGEKVRREADELRAKLEEERRAGEEAERKAQEEAERKAQEEAERKAQEEAERERKEAVEKAWREADALRVKLEEERKASEKAERKVKDEAERKAREDAEREAKEQAERKAKEHAERKDKERAERKDKERAERKDKERAERVARETEERARKEAKDQARREAEARARKEAEDRTRREAEERAQRHAQEKHEAGEKTRNAAEEKARREAAEQARKGVDGRAQDELAAHEREHAEEQRQFDAQNEETERHFAEMEKELEAEQAAAQGGKKPPESPLDVRTGDKARERVRAEAAVHADEAEAALEETAVVYRTPINWGKPVALGLFLILLLGLVLVHFVSFDAYIPQIEKLAGARLRQPVKIKALYLSLVPLPHWRLEGVSVGNEGQLAVAQINAVAELGNMFSEQKVFKSIELESPVLSEEGLRALLFGKPQGQDFKVASVIVRNGKLNSKAFILPALDAKIAVGEDGAWQKIALESPDHKTSLLLEPKGEGAQLEIETSAFNLPFGAAVILEDFSAKGVLGRDELRLSEFKGRIYGGYLSGNASLKWGAGWSLGGDVKVRAMDPGRIAPALLEEGKLEGKAVYAMRANAYDELFAAASMEGTFAVEKGSLLGVDLARLLRVGTVGGKTAFAELSGNFVFEGGKTQLRQIHLGAGPVSAGGIADTDAGKNISGRFAVELKSPVAQARANLALSGTLSEPRFNR